MATKKQKSNFDSLFEEAPVVVKKLVKEKPKVVEPEVILPQVVKEENTSLSEMKDESEEASGKGFSIAISDEKLLHRQISARCNNCFISDKCPNYQPDADCSVNFTRLFHGEFKPSDILESSAIILDLQLQRIQRAALFETQNEGIIDPELSKEISRYFDLLQSVKAISENSTAISIKATGEAAKSNGVLAQLLGLK